MKDFHILALSGGGFRGLFTARVLAGLEEAAGKPIGQCFDLICGTSIGGMIAMGLGIEKSAGDIANIIRDNGADIFPGKGFGYLSVKHDGKGLEKTVKSFFGNKKLGDSKHKILIPVVNYSTGKPQMFKTWWPTDGKRKIADVMMAATAAPSYFPIRQMGDKDETAYLDGGLYANVPGLLGIHEAVFRLDNSIDNVSLLSVGTMREDYGKSNNNMNLGKIEWAFNLFDVIASAQENLMEFMVAQQLGSRYQKIDKLPSPSQSKKLGLDVATPKAIRILCSAAQSEVQKFMLPANIEKWLKHVPASNLKKGEQK